MTELAIYAASFGVAVCITSAGVALLGVILGIWMTVRQLFRDASCVTVGDLLRAIRRGARLGTIVVYLPALFIAHFMRTRVLNPILSQKIYTAQSALRRRQ